MSQTIYLGSDHGGYALKEEVKQWLTEWGYQAQDLGAHTYDANDDYPEFAFAVAEAVAGQSTKTLGILICRSGGGMTIAANKVPGIRAVQVNTPDEARHAKEHNNANIISLAADGITVETAQHTVKAFLATPFVEESRHGRRVAQIADYETQHTSKMASERTA